MRKRTSFIWGISLYELEKVAKESLSLADMLRHFGLVLASGNYKTLKKRLDCEGIDYSHIPLGITSNKGRKMPSKKTPIEEMMVEDSPYSRGNLKRRLLKEGLIENECVICGAGSEWQGKPLVMVLDHINGVNNDHRRENLRLLCPNCNSQTKTFTGRQLRKKHNCSRCGKVITRHSKTGLCRGCTNSDQRKVLERPSREQLLREISESNFCEVGRRYGVSDNAIRKWLKSA